MVPKSRLDEVLAKNKEMQKKLQDMEGKETLKQKSYQNMTLLQKKRNIRI